MLVIQLPTFTENSMFVLKLHGKVSTSYALASGGGLLLFLKMQKIYATLDLQE